MPRAARRRRPPPRASSARDTKPALGCSSSRRRAQARLPSAGRPPVPARFAPRHAPQRLSRRRARARARVRVGVSSSYTSCEGDAFFTRTYAEAARFGLLCEHMFVMDEGTILHADLDAFYASVEQRDDARLRGRPVIVGAGVVLAASYEAKARGVRTAMGGRQARRLCPEAIVVPPRMSAYAEASKAVFRVFDDTTPLVEGLSIDEAFLDVRGMKRIAGAPAQIAVRLRRHVLEQVGLPITVGIARTKFLAKVASGVAKPDGLIVVPPDNELGFLHPLPVEQLWGVGRVTSTKLHSRGITTVGQVARLEEAVLVSMLGRAAGRHLHALAHNRDPRPVRVGRRRRSIGSQRALGRKPRSGAEIDATVVAIVDRIARRLRTGRRVCRTVVLRLRFADYSRATRSHTLSQATAETHTILATARALLATGMPMIERQGLTLVGVAVGNLDDDDAVQLALPFDRHSGGALDAALDDVRDRFGSAAVTRAV